MTRNNDYDDTVEFLDFDNNSGYLHRLKIQQNELPNFEKIFEAEGLYTSKDTCGIETSIEIFDQTRILESFKRKIEEYFTPSVKAALSDQRRVASRYKWYRYLRITFPDGQEYDIVPYRWYIQNGKEISIGEQVWYQGSPVLEYDKNDGKDVWQWQEPDPKPKARAIIVAGNKAIRVLKGSNAFFPRLDGTNTDIADSFKNDIVEALKYWKSIKVE